MAEAQKKLYTRPAARPPRTQDLEKISDELDLQCSSEEIGEFSNYIEKQLADFSILDKMVSPKLPVKYPRVPGYRPPPEENKYNAWYQKCDIVGAESGLLVGKRIAIKDNVCVAGVPMMNGTTIMEDFVPDEDASIITRILDAGGRIVGKTSCESLCFSGSSCTNDVNPTLNPFSPDRSTGGSSGGSAAVVQLGEADMAIGGDQGGSIRIPSSWCGIVGLKPTFGLVPYTGAVAIEITCDHLGPMAKTVYDCALLLEVLAGYDNGLDPRQPRDLTVPKYTELLTGDLSGQKVGLVTEGFAFCEADIQQVVKEAANKLTGAGAVVEDVSIPLHAHGSTIWGPICLEGAYQCMLKGNGHGYHYKGHYTEGVITKMQDGFSHKRRNCSDPIKLTCFLGEYIQKAYGNKFYAKAQNMNRVLTKAYDTALEKYDVIVMPTLPYKAPLLPKEGETVTERLDNSLSMIKNTSPFDATGHPSLSINAGSVDGLPVGMMITGKHFEDAKVLNAAYAVEKVLKN